jgi:hypothetical protein
LNLRCDRAGRRSRRATILVAVLIVLLGMTTAAGAVANRADTAATHAYLAAEYAYRQAVLAELPQSTAMMEALAGRLAGECPGVLAGAPQLERVGEQQFPKAGELRERFRQTRQLGQLVGELDIALFTAFDQPQHPALAAFSAAVAPLRWHSAAINRGVRAYAAVLALPEEAGALDVCADMRAWVASGYKLLSPASKAFIARREARLPRILTGTPAVPPTSPLLRRYEGRAERTLVRRIEALRDQNRLDAPLAAALERLQHALGIANPAFGPAETPAKGSVVLGHGRTAAGETFVARLEPATKTQHGCQINVTIESSGSSAGRCLFRGERAPEPSVNCNAGLLTIESLTRASTRSVRLLLSDGRRITSRALIVPARLGGPVGLYHQVVRGPSPIPVSLTELDARGRTVRVVKLPAIVECTQHPIKYFPGGIRTLVRGTAPGGTRFSIVGEHYRFLGRVYFDLKVRTPPGFGGGGGSSGGAILGSGRPPVFSPEESTGCSPHPYDILYGLLKDRRDTVLVRTGGKLTPLRKVRIPAALHAEGVLVYGAFSAPPTELIVRGPHRRKLLDESRTERSTFEQCESEP